MSISPNSQIVEDKIELERQRKRGLDRQQQRMAAPLILLLYEMGKITEFDADVRIHVCNREAVEIRVDQASLSHEAARQLNKAGNIGD